MSGEGWEDNDESTTFNEEIFQKVTSMPNLGSHTSLLTSLIQAPVPQNKIWRSAPAIRRPRTPNVLQGSFSNATSNTDAPVLSSRETRHEMLTRELHGSSLAIEICREHMSKFSKTIIKTDGRLLPPPSQTLSALASSPIVP